MRKPFIAGNWKMNTTVQEAVKLVRDMLTELNQLNRIDIAVCPPFVSLVSVHDALQGSMIRVGAQNMYFQEKGAYTGEVSPLMLQGLCDFVILGHSERRQYFLESDELISRKIQAAVNHNLKPILCVGENLQEYEAGRTQEVVTRQVEGSLAAVDQADTLTIAYEPVWAIGTGKAATGKQANETIGMIRSLVANKYTNRIAQDLRILYGGSVTPANIAEFVSQPEIDGALVGGASLKARDFVEIVKITSQVRAD